VSQELRQFCLGNGSADFEAGDTAEPPDELDEKAIIEGYIAQADQFVEDQIVKLDWSQLQDLVAGILRAMGYRTKVSGPGPDRGVDVFASPDGLGLAEPRIFVQVKHREGSVGGPGLLSFLGGRQPGDRCLYVSTGGFSAPARLEANRSAIPTTLLAMPDLRELLLYHYEMLDSETRALVPLKKVYWPIVE
jgi:restriction system protein